MMGHNFNDYGSKTFNGIQFVFKTSLQVIVIYQVMQRLTCPRTLPPFHFVDFSLLFRYFNVLYTRRSLGFLSLKAPFCKENVDFAC